MQRSIFASASRNRHRDIFAVMRRNEPIDRGLARWIELVRIQHHPFRFQVLRRGERYQHLLLLGRLKLAREQNARSRNNSGIARRSFRVPISQLLLDRGTVRQLIEVLARSPTLRIRPGFNRRIIILLQPLIVVFDLHPLVFIRNRFLGRLWQRSRARQIQQSHDPNRAADNERKANSH